jgi:predicted phosphodiesterase
LRTLIVSDLHLGSASRVDVLRRPELRAPLLEALSDVDRLVLLGDVLELRHGPRRDALAAARPFFEDLGRAFAGREVVVLAGNHDHALVEPWLARRSEQAVPRALGVEQRFAADDASPMLAQLAAWAAPARLTAAYPGLWLRPDVYATHGHYLDCHLTIPTLERLGIGAMSRVLRRPPRTFAGPDDYEAVTEPVFAWIDAIARQAPTGDTLNGGTTVRAWRVLRGVEETPEAASGGADGKAGSSGSGSGSDNGGGVDGGARRNGGWAGRLGALTRTLRARTLAGAFPLAVAALNRAGLGPLNADLSSGELRRAGLRGMGEAAARLGLGEAYVVFGHTHRAGPLPGDRDAEWSSPGGARLVNVGCWTYDAYFLTPVPGESPYWPGGCVLVDDDGPPRLLRLLQDRGHAELRPPALSEDELAQRPRLTEGAQAARDPGPHHLV